MIEPYAKDKNLLQLSLFCYSRGKARKKRMSITWKDSSGKCELRCVCDHGVPGAFDQDTYTAVMRLWIKNGMPNNGLEINYSDIARELNLLPEKNYVKQIRKSLLRLGGARYEFIQCFLRPKDNGELERITTQFSLFDSTSLFDYREGKSKKNSYSRLYFSKEIQRNLEKKYYQLLDMAWYRMFPSGLPRRLYEYLEKRRYHGVEGTFSISEETLCQWLSLVEIRKDRRRKRIQKACDELINGGYLSKYNFDKTRDMCVFTYSKNAKPKMDIDIVEKVKDGDQQVLFLEACEWIKSIKYFQKKKVKEIAALPIVHVIGVYPEIRAEYEQKISEGQSLKPSWVYQRFTDGFTLTKKIEKQQDNNQQVTFAEFEDNNIDALYELLKSESKTLKKSVARWVASHGYDYVKNNILYANQNAKKAYSSYLGRSLKENWGAIWAEEEDEKKLKEIKIKQKKNEDERKRIEFEKRKAAEKAKIEKQKEKFKSKVLELPRMVCEMFLNEAEQKIAKNAIGRDMNVKIEYSKLLLKAFNEEGAKFCDEVVSELPFIKEIFKISLL